MFLAQTGVMVGGVLQHCAWSRFMTQWVKNSSSEPNLLKDVKLSFSTRTIFFNFFGTCAGRQGTFHMTSCIQFICLHMVLVKAINVTEFSLKKFTATGSSSSLIHRTDICLQLYNKGVFVSSLVKSQFHHTVKHLLQYQNNQLICLAFTNAYQKMDKQKWQHNWTSFIDQEYLSHQIMEVLLPASRGHSLLTTTEQHFFSGLSGFYFLLTRVQSRFPKPYNAHAS